MVRLRPRPNLEVNRHFICDYGRLNYRWMNRGDRVEAPLVRDGGQHVAADWDVALDRSTELVAQRTGHGRGPGLWPGLDRIAGPWVRQLEGRGHRAPLQVPLGNGAAGRDSDLALRAERAPTSTARELAGYLPTGTRRAGRGGRRWSSCSTSS